MDFFSEIRYVLRGLIKNRGFAFVVIFSVALGIGTTTAIFSMVDAVLLRPLPYSSPDRLVALYESIPEKGVPQLHVSGPNFQDWRNASRTVQKMSAYSESFFNVSGHDYPERVPGIHVSEDFFALLGVQPLYGRFFSQPEFKKRR